MKTLNDVIESLDIEYLNEIGRYEGFGRYMLYDEEIADVLHYLKEYKNLDWKEDLLDAYRYAIMVKESRPLTWDELKGMVGKPVWVESSDSFNRRRWMFVGEWFDDDEMRLFDMGNDYPDYVSKNGYESGTWQAYRKERSE